MLGKLHRRVALALTLLVVIAGAVTASVFAAHRWIAPSSGTEAQLRMTVIDFELATASVRPMQLIGKQLTPADEAFLQARFLQRMQRVAAGSELQRWQSWDYAAALTEDEGNRGEFASCTGKLVYWDFVSRELDGSVVVRAGVARRYRIVRWDAEAHRAVPYRHWQPSVSVNDYALDRSGDAWKIFAVDHWMFYDPATGQLSTGP